MIDKKIIVPVGMLEAVSVACGYEYVGQETPFGVCLEAALRWLSENPIVPTDAFLHEVRNRDFFGGDGWTDAQVVEFCKEWQRRMFLVLEVPEALKDIWDDGWTEWMKIHTMKAYRRGQESR